MPDKIDIQGKIVEISYGHCGILCFGGTIKVKLREKIKGYNEIFIYVVVPCLERPPNDSTINVKATKLHSKEKECYFKSINNFIDSHGIPFYKLNELEASKITTATAHNIGFCAMAIRTYAHRQNKTQRHIRLSRPL